MDVKVEFCSHILRIGLCQSGEDDGAFRIESLSVIGPDGKDISKEFGGPWGRMRTQEISIRMAEGAFVDVMRAIEDGVLWRKYRSYPVELSILKYAIQKGRADMGHFLGIHHFVMDSQRRIAALEMENAKLHQHVSGLRGRNAGLLKKAFRKREPAHG